MDIPDVLTTSVVLTFIAPPGGITITGHSTSPSPSGVSNSSEQVIDIRATAETGNLLVQHDETTNQEFPWITVGEAITGSVSVLRTNERTIQKDSSPDGDDAKLEQRTVSDFAENRR